jgi:peptidyl-prolyl cis-trans isomerase SurA
VKKWSLEWGGWRASSLIKSMKHYARISIAAAIIFLLLPFFPGPSRADQIVDRIVATVDGDPITMHDLRRYAAASGTTLPPDDSPGSQQIKRDVLEKLIGEKVMDHEMSAVEVDDDQIDRFIVQFEAGNHITDIQLHQQLEQHGITWEAYRKRVRQEIQKMTMLQQHVRDKVVITPQQIELYYKTHIADFTSSQERFKLAQILVAADATNTPPTLMEAARAKAEALRKRALKGEDFSQLAATYSDDDSKAQGGELGYFKPDEVNDQILAAISKLKSGQISPVVKTSHGFHIVKVEEHQEAGVRPLKDVSQRIRDKLAEEQMEIQFRRWMNTELIKDHSVQTYL